MPKAAPAAGAAVDPREHLSGVEADEAEPQARCEAPEGIFIGSQAA